ECRQDVPYVGEDPGYRGDNVVYLCRSLSHTPLRHQQDRPAEDSGLRCAERNNYTITFAEPEPWQSQVMKSNFRNFSRSSFKTSIQSVKQSSQMRLPRGRRSDTETESEFSTCGSTEVPGSPILSDDEGDVPSDEEARLPLCDHIVVMQVRPHPNGWVYASEAVCQARKGRGKKNQEADTSDGRMAVMPYCLDRPTKRTSECCRRTAGSAQTSTQYTRCLSSLFEGPESHWPRGYTDPLTLENWWHKGVTWAWERDFYLEV
ncbi:unnamed protein product, partial [Cladocopium goreaui]